MASVEEFVKAPTEGLLNLLPKGQLWALVEHYEIGELDKRLKKNELKTILRAKLLEKNILLLSEKLSQVEEIKKSADLFSSLSFEQKREILAMQQEHDREGMIH